MAGQVFATKGNLINTKKTLSLAKLGYELLDRKRNILIRELMSLIDSAERLRGTIEQVYGDAYEALQLANITMGVVSPVAERMPVDNSFEISYKNVMGVQLPCVEIAQPQPQMSYSLSYTNSQLDKAYIAFCKVKEITATLAQVENSVYRLAIAIKKTQRRANALKNIIIPDSEHTVKFIADSLEEKEREEFSRLKVIKAQKSRS